MKVAYLFISFPTLSQTFLQREIRGVAAAGIEVEVHSMWTSPAATAWEPTPGVTLRQWRPRDLLHPLAVAGSLARHARAAAALEADLLRFPPRSFEDVQHALLGELFAFRHADYFRRGGFDLIHGAWATAPATAALWLGRLCGLPFSFGAHAYDIHRRGGDRYLPYKLDHAALVHTTTRMNVDYLSALRPAARAKIVLARRGLAALPPLAPARPLQGPARILSVGRLIPKKGQASQIDAVAALKAAGRAVELRIVGEGPLRESLARQIVERGLDAEVQLLGPLPEAAVREQYAWADCFWHAGIVDAEGDRDGLPNVIPEAMSHGVPVVSSDTAGADEAVIDGETGLLAPGGTPQALAAATTRLLDDAGLRERVRQGGHAWVAENFLVAANARKLAVAFRAAMKV
jgi:colanic acid/amylovoran biosynthesis glycosyltransferase